MRLPFFTLSGWTLPGRVYTKPKPRALAGWEKDNRPGDIHGNVVDAHGNPLSDRRM